ncbi:MAG: sigma-70 family RNA polymerase sigma factor [Planctomycetales bacterium]|nr:sigma-70 family RNA polymerase sigma factor [Planctomycetales bacterium]
MSSGPSSSESQPFAANALTSELFETVYEELRGVAERMMQHERRGHTLSATALVNEAYLRLRGNGTEDGWNSRGHFFVAAAEAMRRILIDRARAKATLKRGAVRSPIDIDSMTDSDTVDLDLVLDVDALLERFSEIDPVAAQLVKLRMYAGQSVVEAGQHLGLTRWSAYQLWHFCRSWFEVHARDL